MPKVVTKTREKGLMPISKAAVLTMAQPRGHNNEEGAAHAPEGMKPPFRIEPELPHQVVVQEHQKKDSLQEVVPGHDQPAVHPLQVKGVAQEPGCDHDEAVKEHQEVSENVELLVVHKEGEKKRKTVLWVRRSSIGSLVQKHSSVGSGKFHWFGWFDEKQESG